MAMPPWFHGSLFPIERPIYVGDVACLLSFRCDRENPLAGESGPIRNHIFTFPMRSIALQHEGEPRFVAGPNVIPLFNRRQEYSRKPVDPRGGVDTTYFAVAPDVLLEAAFRCTPRSAESRPEHPFTRSHVPSSPDLFLRYRRILDMAAAGEESLAIDEEIVMLVERLFAASASRPLSRFPPSRERVEHAKLLLARDPAATIPIREIAQAIDTSVYHLCRIFRQETGLSLRNYRLQLRLRLALDEVPHSPDLLDTALKLGFNSHSHFTAAFRKAFGMTPSEYRRRKGFPAVA